MPASGAGAECAFECNRISRAAGRHVVLGLAAGSGHEHRAWSGAAPVSSTVARKPNPTQTPASISLMSAASSG